MPAGDRMAILGLFPCAPEGTQFINFGAAVRRQYLRSFGMSDVGVDSGAVDRVRKGDRAVPVN